jgi:hypothetical protein
VAPIAWRFRFLIAVDLVWPGLVWIGLVWIIGLGWKRTKEGKGMFSKESERKKDFKPIEQSQMIVRVTDLEITSKMWRFLFFS